MTILDTIAQYAKQRVEDARLKVPLSEIKARANDLPRKDFSNPQNDRTREFLSKVL